MHSGMKEAYLAYEPDLLRYLGTRFGLTDRAADIVHEIYLKLCRTEEPVGVRDRRAYLFSMAANLATDQLRTEQRRGAILAEADGIAWLQADERTPERHALAQAEIAHLTATIEALPRRCREVFYLYRFEDRTQAEIAETLGIGITSVYKDLKTAVGALVAARRRFHDSPAGRDRQDDRTE